MPLSRLGSFGATHRDAVTSVSKTWANPGPSSQQVVHATVGVCLSLLGDATANDFYLEAGEYAIITVDPTTGISFVCAPNEPNGDIRFTAAGG